jgi:hypothetical protein
MSSPDPYRPVLCGINRNEYLNVKLNYYGALNDYVNKLPSAKVLFLGETRSYYCRKSMIAPTYFDVNPFFAWANNAPGGDALLSSLQQEHITHILFNQTEYERLGFARQLTIKGQNAFDQLKRDHLVVEYSDKNTRVYSINPLAGAPQ